MLAIICRSGGSRYAIDARQVREVLPRVHLHRPPGLPSWAAGVLQYRQTPLPVIDLAQLVEQEETRFMWSNRVLVLNPPRLSFEIGLIVEFANTVQLEEDVFRANVKKSGLAKRDFAGSTEQTASAFGPVMFDSQGMFQTLDPGRLIEDRVGALAEFTGGGR